ncbi:DUF1295 domain-containing protein [Halovulum dunhuangense]|uniref:DUF1295 domain-containing protein n=1 Tax=Halovulum dunhuangense TaxID=1505036 RepID=A0A849L3S3_9RHOB|nr:DUF1295 domain-containing protein [Halovulum dunhuangense]NNU80817.1 DUF1295 domain-containing protein [Halovulum dunhuangense]
MDVVIEHGWIWLVSLGGFLALWPISLLRRDASIVDFWWGPGFGAMAVALWLSMGRPTDGMTLAILVPLLLWSARLGVHLGLRRIREGEEDARYQELRAAWQPGWAWKSLFVVFLLQSVLQGLTAMGVLAGLARAPGVAPSAGVYVLSALAILAAIVELISDLQLDRFRARVPHGGLLTTGLRGIVRYPSYSAEIAFWSLLSLLAVVAGVWWAPLSALLIFALLRYVSGVAVLEDRLARTRPDFESYRARVPALMPRLMQRGPGAGSGQRKAAD